MGNFCSKSDSVHLEANAKEVQCPRMSLRKRLLCFDNRVAPFIEQRRVEREEARELNDVESSASSLVQVDNANDATNSSGEPRQLDFTLPRSQLLMPKLELPSAKIPLPRIGQTSETWISQTSVKCDPFGKTRSVYFDVSLNGRPKSTYATRHAARPRRLPNIARFDASAR